MELSSKLRLKPLTLFQQCLNTLTRAFSHLLSLTLSHLCYQSLTGMSSGCSERNVQSSPEMVGEASVKLTVEQFQAWSVFCIACEISSQQDLIQISSFLKVMFGVRSG